MLIDQDHLINRLKKKIVLNKSASASSVNLYNSILKVIETEQEAKAYYTVTGKTKECQGCGELYFGLVDKYCRMCGRKLIKKEEQD